MKQIKKIQKKVSVTVAGVVNHKLRKAIIYHKDVLSTTTRTMTTGAVGVAGTAVGIPPMVTVPVATVAGAVAAGAVKGLADYGCQKLTNKKHKRRKSSKKRRSRKRLKQSTHFD